MATNRDYKKEWFAKARVDYFSPFINLWLACNSWYNFHYSLMLRTSHRLKFLKSHLIGLHKELHADSEMIDFMFKFQALKFEDRVNGHKHMIVLSSHSPRR